jgi:hypothetical protein
MLPEASQQRASVLVETSGKQNSDITVTFVIDTSGYRIAGVQGDS